MHDPNDPKKGHPKKGYFVKSSPKMFQAIQISVMCFGVVNVIIAQWLSEGIFQCGDLRNGCKRCPSHHGAFIDYKWHQMTNQNILEVSWLWRSLKSESSFQSSFLFSACILTIFDIFWRMMSTSSGGGMLSLMNTSSPSGRQASRRCRSTAPCHCSACPVWRPASRHQELWHSRFWKRTNLKKSTGSFWHSLFWPRRPWDPWVSDFRTTCKPNSVFQPPISPAMGIYHYISPCEHSCACGADRIIWEGKHKSVLSLGLRIRYRWFLGAMLAKVETFAYDAEHRIIEALVVAFSVPSVPRLQSWPMCRSSKQPVSNRGMWSPRLESWCQCLPAPSPSSRVVPSRPEELLEEPKLETFEQFLGWRNCVWALETFASSVSVSVIQTGSNRYVLHIKSTAFWDAHSFFKMLSSGEKMMVWIYCRSIIKDHKRINQRKPVVPCIRNLTHSTKNLPPQLLARQGLATAHFILPAFGHLLCILRRLLPRSHPNKCWQWINQKTCSCLLHRHVTVCSDVFRCVQPVASSQQPKQLLVALSHIVAPDYPMSSIIRHRWHRVFLNLSVNFQES